jgi:hypothetical protein
MLYSTSRRLALARCVIHILPASISIGLAALIITGYFIGRELQGEQDKDVLKLTALQIAAKLQDISFPRT